MIDTSVLLFEIVPALVGIIAVAYSVITIVRMGPHFFRAVSGWLIVAFMGTLLVVWVADLAGAMGTGLSSGARHLVDTGFIVATSWLGVCIVSMTTVHNKYNEMRMFGAWFVRRPVNTISIYALGGVVAFVAAAAILSGSDGSVTGSLLASVLAFIIVSAAAEAAMPIINEIRGHLRFTREAQVQAAAFAIAWMAVPAAQFALRLVPGMESYLADMNPSSWIIVASFLVMMRIIFATRFMAIIVDPEVETSKRGGFRSFDIPRGVYLTYDEKAGPAFHLFSETVSLPLRPDAQLPGVDTPAETLTYLIPRGLVMARSPPDRVRETYNLQATPIVWLTEAPGERRIAPTSLAMVTDTMVRFMEDNPNSIVLLEGLEYLVTFNDFKKVLKSLDALNETAWVSKARLIIAINPRAFEPKELALLERDRVVLRGVEGIEELKRESRVLREHPV